MDGHSEHNKQMDGLTAARADLRPWIPVAIGVVLALFRLFVAMHEPIVPTIGMRYDDSRMAWNAEHLLSGEWLGSYEYGTLIKNPGYPLFLCIPTLTGLSYGTVFMLLHIAACALFCLAINRAIPSKWIRLLLFTALLYMPVLFTQDKFQRLYRAGVVFPFVVTLFSSYTALWLRRDESLPQLLPWMLLCTISLPTLYYIKEDGAWCLPFVGVVTLVLLGYWVLAARQRTKEVTDQAHTHARRKLAGLVVKGLLLLLPALSLLMAQASIKQLNSTNYGVNIVCERTDGAFARFYHELLSIDAGEPDEDIWVSREALDLALDYSPTLSSIEDYIWAFWDVWADKAHFEPHAQGEMAKDIGVWALMDAYDGAGGFVSATETEAFWDACTRELEAAFDDGSLTRKQGLWISSSTQPIPYAEIPQAIWDTRNVFSFVLSNNLEFNTVSDPAESSPEAEEVLALVGAVRVPEYSGLSLWVARHIVTAGRTLAWPLTALSGICLLILLFFALVRGDADARSLCLIVLGFLLSALVVAIGIWWTLKYEGPRCWPIFSYSSAMFPLLYMVEALAVGFVLQRGLQRATKQTGTPQHIRPAR